MNLLIIIFFIFKFLFLLYFITQETIVRGRKLKKILTSQVKNLIQTYLKSYL